MGFLRRALGGGEKAPEWASFMKADEYRDFEAAIRADFQSRGLTVRIEDDGAFVGRGDDERVYGLSNLAQLCNQLDRSDWPKAIREHFDSLVAAEGETDRIEDFEYARALLKPRIFPVDGIPPDSLEKMPKMALSGDLVAVLAIDLPTTVNMPPNDLVEQWGVPIDELFHLASEHLAAEAGALERERLDLGDGVSAELIYGDSFFVASQLLRFADLVSPPPNGAIVAIPHRHMLVWHPIQDARSLMIAVPKLLQFATFTHQEGPGSISPNVYWWHTGALTLIPGVVTKGKVEIAPPEAFTQLLNSLT